MSEKLSATKLTNNSNLSVSALNSSDASMQEDSYPSTASASSEESGEVLEFEGKLLALLGSKRSKRESRYLLETVEAIDSNRTEFSYGNLDHFSTYAVSIRACRKPDRTDLEDSHEDFCSAAVEIIAKTGKNDDADNIEQFDAVALPSNKTQHAARISWTPPNEPNGLVLNYIIIQTNNDDPQTPELICISLLGRENVSSQIIDNMKPGNYSFQIAAVTLAGQGNFTNAMFLVIDSPSFFNFFASPSFIMLLLMIAASTIAVVAYNVYKRSSTSDILSSFDNFDSDNELVRD